MKTDTAGLFAVPAVLLVALSCASAARRAAPAPVKWRTDLAAAREEARAARKPLLVVFRCPHDTVSAGLDAALTRPTDPALARLLADGFVTARVQSLKGVDLNTFRFDYDLTLAAVVVDPATGKTITRWGTRDGESATSRLSVAGLKHALTAVTATRVGAPATTAAGAPFTVADFRAFTKTKRAKEPCYHCHYAHDARIAQERADGTFRKASLWMYPHPENLGLTLDLAHNNVVASVAQGGLAAKAGVRPGDAIVGAAWREGKRHRVPIHTAADLQHLLHDGPQRGELRLDLRRGTGPQREAMLLLRKGWRETDISWRPSQGAVPPLVGIWESPLAAEERAAAGIAPGRLALRITFVFEGERWAKSYGGLRKGDVIVDVDGEKLPEMSARQFHAWFRMHHEVGDEARFSVLRDGERIDVSVPCVDVSFD